MKAFSSGGRGGLDDGPDRTAHGQRPKSLHGTAAMTTHYDQYPVKIARVLYCDVVDLLTHEGVVKYTPGKIGKTRTRKEAKTSISQSSHIRSTWGQKCSSKNFSSRK